MDALVVVEFAAEEAAEAGQEVPRGVLRVFKDRSNPLEEYTDRAFIRRYRISKDSFRYVLDLIGPQIEHPTRRNRALLPIEQLAVALQFYAFGCFQIEFGDSSGVSQATCCVVRRVSEAICGWKERFIRFPTTAEERRVMMQGFYEIAAFPGVIGAIDGTHVAIVSPGGADAIRFINRKQFDSGANRGILLGDPAYTCRPYMMTPIRNPRTPAETRYNTAQRRTRGLIERAYGILKKRFHSVGDRNSLRCQLQGSMAIIVATACLHNLAIQRNDAIPPQDDDPRPIRYEQPELAAHHVEAHMRGNLFRDRFIREHFQWVSRFIY
ncbi:putative nuclease HARBI1 [Lineus longissimus]|uniref:putative nuclease HARBI1 n=1 Tax=Lineus longissimus TaxID=88925 RepID=UPI00315C96D8